MAGGALVTGILEERDEEEGVGVIIEVMAELGKQFDEQTFAG